MEENLDAAGLLDQLSRLDVRLSVSAGQLKIDAPKGALSEAVIQRIRHNKAGLIAALSRPESQTYGVIPRVGPGEEVFASPAQKRLWVLEQFNLDGQPLYNISLLLRAHGPLDGTAMEASINEIVRRHESLRTVFAPPKVEDKEPCQKVIDGFSAEVLAEDFSGAKHPELRVREYASSKIAEPFDLAQGPLFRLSLLRLAPEEHALLFVFHHTIFDGLSIRIFLDELRRAYAALSRGCPAGLPPLPVQYRDYSQWHRGLLEISLEQGLRYWRSHLDGAPPLIDLPADRPRPALPAMRGARARAALGAELSRRLREYSRSRHVTCFATFYAAFAALLFRHMDAYDVVIGTPVTNRRHKSLEGLIGFFANTLPLRLKSAPATPFPDFLRDVQAAIAEALHHQDTPFEHLIDSLNVKRCPSYNPVFQVMFTFQDNYLENYALEGLAVRPVELEAGTAQFDLTLIVRESPEAFAVIFEYSTELFDGERMAMMLERFKHLLGAVAGDDRRPLCRLPLMPAGESRLLRALNPPLRCLPSLVPVVQLFEAQAALNPGVVVAVFGQERWTYAELNARANRLARRLVELGVGAEKIVAICLERGLETLAAVLATLKARGAYLALDENQPKERLLAILDDAAPLAVVTRPGLKEHFLGARPRVLCLEAEQALIESHPTNNLGLWNAPADLAYVIFTSGTTGVPKGVAITHSNLLNTLHAYEEAYLGGDTECHLQMANFVFDVFTADWTRALCKGKRLVLCPEEVRGSAEALFALLVRERVDFVDWVPAVARGLVQYLERTAQRLDFLKVCIVGSDTCFMREYRSLKALCSADCRVINAYGVTEAAIDSTYFSSAAPSLPDEAVVPLGKPFANTQVYVLDNQLDIAPLGVPGELAICGDTLGRGYLNRPELDREKFVTVELEGRTRRVYRTGDRACWRTDGNLHFLGRMDNQIKIRGSRIELGEIESALMAHHAVGEAMVVPDNDLSTEALSAFVVLNGDLENPAHALRTWLGERLPIYMVPSEFIFLDELPVTANGKIDRAALPQAQGSRPQRRFVAPRDSLELRLALVWGNVLGTGPVGVKDSFFDAGGDSLTAVMLITAAKREFGVKLPLYTMFQNDTVEQMASLLRRGEACCEWSPLVCLQPGGSKRPHFCVHAAGGVVFRYAQMASLLGGERPFYGIQARGIENAEEVYPDVRTMARAYVAAIRGVQPSGPYLISGWSFGGTVAFEMSRQLEEAGESVPAILMFDAPSPYLEGSDEDEVEFLLERLRPAAGLSLENVHLHTTQQARLHYLFEQQKLAGLFAPDVDFSYAETRLKVHMHHNRILSRYRPSGPFKGRIIFFKPMEKIPFDSKMDNPIPAWKPLAAGGLEVCDAPGNHFNMFSPEHAPVLASLVNRQLQLPWAAALDA